MWCLGESKQLKAFRVQREALEELVQIEDAIASPFQNLYLVVKAFDEATSKSFDKVIGDDIEPRFNGHEKRVEGSELTFADSFTPSSNRTLGSRLGISLGEYLR